jgi:transcriptional regulator with XRE-family HTH domain
MAQNTNMREYVAARIRELRNQYGKEGLSQEALAQLIGVATNTISRWETGTYQPTLDDLEQLARALGVPILSFFPRPNKIDEKEEKVDALLRAAQGLDAADLDELRKYAEFRRARSIYKPRGKR